MTGLTQPNGAIANQAFGAATLQRIEWLTIVLGGCGAAWAGWQWGWRGAAGVVLGTALSWINFRWLKGSVLAFGRVAVPQAGAATGEIQAVRVPAGAYLKFFGRFALLLGVVYVILTRSWLPAVPLFAGLFASAAATVLALVYELLLAGVRQSLGGGQ